MTLAQSQVLTLAAFFQRPEIEDSPAWEYINGVAIQKPMGGGKHSALQKLIIRTIDQAGAGYEAFPELRCTVGDRSVVADIVVLASSQIPLDEMGEITSTGITFAPTWVIEILSPNQSQTRVTGNLLHCLKYGSQLGWLVDPQERSVLVFQPDRLPDLLTDQDKLPSLASIELHLSVEQLFLGLKRSI